MKKTIIAVALISLLFMALASPVVLAAESRILQNLQDTVRGTDLRASDSTTLTGFVSAIINGLLGLLGIIFVCIILYGGWLWMIDMGNADNVKKAKALIKNAVIGVIIVLAAGIISNYVIITIEGNLAQGGPEATSVPGPTD